MNKQRARAMRAAGKAPPDTAPSNAITAAAALVEPATRTVMIAEGAYYRAEKRGFCPGQELDDWLAAELEVDRTFAGGREASALLE